MCLAAIGFYSQFRENGSASKPPTVSVVFFQTVSLKKAEILKTVLP